MNIKYTPEGNFKAIRDWREDDRPRERLMKHGAETLSDAELLAILIGSGTIGFSAIDAAKILLDRHGNVTRLAACDLSEFKQIKGLGDAKAVTLAAAFELSKRVQSEPFMEKKALNSPEQAASYFIPRLRGARTEVFRTLLLNSSNQLFREVPISEGSLNSSVVHPREVFRIAITESAASIILMHNHPSGNTTPSKEDISITKNLVEAGKIVDIKVLDHIIIAGDSFISLAQEGYI